MFFRQAGSRPGVVCIHANASELEGLGHMGPVTHPDRVNEVMARFLERNAA